MTTNHQGYPLTLVGTVNPSAGGGIAAPIGTLYQRNTNGTVFSKTGAADTAWTQLAPAAANPQQSFSVTPGAGLSTFDVALQTAWTNNGYLPQVTMAAVAGSPAAYKQFRIASDTQTTAHFTIELNTPTEAADVFNIFIPAA